MKRFITTIILLFVFSLLMSACSNDKIDKKSSSMSSTNSTTIKGNETLGANHQDIQETFYGNWIIKGEITSGGVSGLSDEDIEKMIGKKLTYSSEAVSFDNYILKNPKYKKTILSEDDFYVGFRISMESIGLKEESAVEVDIYTDKECNTLWDSVGNMFIEKNKDTLILYHEGVYFELVRTS